MHRDDEDGVKLDQNKGCIMKIKFPDGSIKEYKHGITPYEVAESISKGLAKEVVAAKVDNQMYDLNRHITNDCEIFLYKFKDKEGKEVYWHSTSHIMAQAVKRLFPNVKVTIGPPIENGFYYDFDTEKPFTDDDLTRIEAEMKKIIAEGEQFIRREVTKQEALDFFKDKNEYKVELIKELPENEQITFYQSGEFIDLCRGPHLPNANMIKETKLLHSSGAYWRGDERNKMLQRIYGISFPSKKELKSYLQRLQEAKRRDHRKIGKELGLFATYDQIGAGLVHWLPNGARIRDIIEDFWKKEHYKDGYELIYTPHIGRGSLWRTSGHLDFYKESMYPPLDIEGEDYYIKPMNCPFHIAIYNSHLHSYRDLPIKYAELGTVYRYEMSGVLHGLMRVRGFTQDDAHLICTPEQLQEEVIKLLDFTLYMLKSFGFNKYEFFLSTRPEKSIGEPADWEKATETLRVALETRNFRYEIDQGGGAFYGPKIDIYIKDALDRAWQCTTIQFDFNLSSRFNMTYIGEDGQEHRPYVVHRALLGSMERFFGVLIEHYAGNFPVWLSPQQVQIIPVSEHHLSYAEEVYNHLNGEEIRVKIDRRNEKVGYKIRDAENKKIPYMLIVGDKEIESNTVSVRRHLKGDLGSFSLSEFISKIKDEIESKK